MPWRFYQSAIADKRLRLERLAAARSDTGIGAIVTQLIMGAILLACAAMIGRRTSNASLDTIGEMTQALISFLGTTAGYAAFGAGVIGKAIGSAIERPRVRDPNV